MALQISSPLIGCANTARTQYTRIWDVQARAGGRNKKMVWLWRRSNSNEESNTGGKPICAELPHGACLLAIESMTQLTSLRLVSRVQQCMRYCDAMRNRHTMRPGDPLPLWREFHLCLTSQSGRTHRCELGCLQGEHLGISFRKSL